MTFDEKTQLSKRLENQYRTLRIEGELEESFKVEKEYLKIRQSIIDDIDIEVKKRKALPLAVIKRQVAQRPKPIRRESGIRIIDEKMTDSHEVGGFAVGNFIQVTGSRGAGKTSLLLKIITNISQHENVVWFDFEMGERRFTEKIKAFNHDDTKFMYYNADRKIGAIIDEIKLQYAYGARQFVIDSAMKVISGGDRYEQFSGVSKALSELTSTLEINIWMINQMSQSAENDGRLSIKHGNDAEYDADIIFFLLAPTLGKDGMGVTQVDQGKRLLYCTKNRQDDRTFNVDLPKSAIFGVEYEVVDYAEE